MFRTTVFPHVFLWVGTSFFAGIAMADTPLKVSTESHEVSPAIPKVLPEHQPLPKTLPSVETKENDVVYTPQYLVEHPEEFEKLLRALLINGEASGLKLLLPIYHQVPNADPAVFDWGNAIIAMQERDFKKAVELYRTINSKIPDNTALRFQMALALYANGELIAAKDQLNKLRSSATSEKDAAVVDRYIAMIDSRDQWDFNGGITYAYSNNINNAPPVGTKLLLPNDAVVTSTTKPKKARGFSYNFSADKTWSLSAIRFAALHFDVNGTQYFDEKNYNDLGVKIGGGYGIRTGQAKAEIIPYVQKRFYGLGESGDGHLKPYTFSYGLRLEGQYWFSQNLRYQSTFDLSRDNYTERYHHLDGNTWLLSNSLLYATGPKQFFYGGIDLVNKTASDPSDAYHRYGLRFGWQRDWGKGISTSTNIGFSKRLNKGEDFFGMRRTDENVNFGLSIWNRDWHFKGITPRLTFSSAKTHSNNPLYNSKSQNVYIDFSKTF